MRDLIIAEPQSAHQRLPPLVVDCSVLAAVLFDEPERDAAAQVLAGKALFAPWLLDHEMVSVAVKKAHSGLADVAERALEDLARLRMTRRSPDIQAQWQLAWQKALSAYDAAYLQLAVEVNAPLATFDQKLGNAAQRVLRRDR